MNSNQCSYNRLLDIINSIGTTHEFYLFEPYFGALSKNVRLTNAERQYLMQKFEMIEFDFQNSLETGKQYVWNLSSRQRSYKAYLYSLRYIKTLKSGTRQFSLMQRFYLMLKHDNGIGRYMSEYKKESLACELLRLLNTTVPARNKLFIILDRLLLGKT